MPSDRIYTKSPIDEAIAAAFAKPAAENALVPIQSTSLSVSDAIITAQKVAVERDEAKILQKIRVLANAVGEDFYYRYPVKNKDGTSWIEGPSIKCANNVARLYGNCQIDTRVVDNGDSWIIYARFTDYETGFSYTRPFQQRKGQEAIRSRDAGRQLDIALQIGVSKAIRNVICNALETFTTFAFEEAKASIAKKVGENLERYRDRVLGRLEQLGVALGRVEAATGRAAKDWLAPDVARIITQIQAIGDGMATIDETWPPVAGQSAQAASPPRPTREEYQAEHWGASDNGTATASPHVAIEPFPIIDVWGNELLYPSLEAAIEAYRAALDDADKQKGDEGLHTVIDNNGPFFAALDEQGHTDVSRELSLEGGKMREAAQAREAAMQKVAEGIAVARQHTPVPHGTEPASPSPAETRPDEVRANTEHTGPNPRQGVPSGETADQAPSAAPTRKEDGALLGGEPTENVTVPLPRNPTPEQFDYFGRQMLAMIAEGTNRQRAARIKLANEHTLNKLREVNADLHHEIMATLRAAR